MKNRWFIAAAALVLIVAGFASLPAFAQQTGTIEGLVVDSNNAPLPGVSIEVKSAALQGTRTTVTDANGRYKFPVVPPGSYTVTSSLSGFTKAEKTNVRVALGGTASINVTMAVSVKEEVVVTGEAPVIDTTRAVLGASTSIDTIQKLPLGRNFTSIATTVAGTGTSAGGGITVYGATGLENQYIIDGVNTTGIKIGNQGKTLNNEFVQEVEVKSGGYEAEYGRALGGIINVVTKSGGNEFHGDVFGYYDSKSLASSDAHSDDRTAVAASQFIQPTRVDYGLDLGGYFLKDRIWFFGAYDRVARDQDYSRILQRNYNSSGVATSVYGDGTDQTRTDQYSGKLTFRLGESNTISASVFGDPGTFSGRQTTLAGPDSAVIYDSKQGGTDFTAKWDGLFGTQFLVQAQYGHHEEKNQNQSPYENTLGIIQYRNGLQQAAPGSGPTYFVNENYKRDAYKVAGTLFLGAHEVKLGADYEDIKSSFSEKYPGGARIFNFLATKTGAFQYSYQRYFAKIPLNCNELKNGKTGNFGPVGPGTGPTTCAAYDLAQTVDNPPHTKNIGIFAQDAWRVMPNLTVNVGIRYEEQRLLDAAGATAITLKGEWSPRIGIVWDFLNNGKSRFFASYGRFYTTIPQDIQTRALGNEYTVFAYNYSQNTLNPRTDPAFFEYADPTIQGGELTQDNLKGMYQDEIIGGFEMELAKNWSFGVKGIYKALGRAIEDRCDLADPRVGLSSYIPAGALTTCALVNPGNDSPLQVIKDPTNADCQGPDPNVLSGNCSSIIPRRYYRGLEVNAMHRISAGLYVLANYTYSKLEGNYSGNLSQTREAGQSDPNINADFDYIDLTPNNFGTLRNDRTHMFKLSGSYTFPFNLTTALNVGFQTGRPMSVRGYARPGYSQERYYIPRGSFYTMPSTYQVDLHLEYGLRLGAVTIFPVVDVFNLTNFQGTVSRDEVFCTSTGTCNAVLADGSVRKDGPYTTDRSSNPNFNRDISWQAPRVIRLGARVSF